MSPVGVIIPVVLLLSSKQVVGKEVLPPPRNVTLVSKDFSLFLTWLPDERYPPGVSYGVQWSNAFAFLWKDIPHCRNISETSCNITCVSPELNNRYLVEVKAQMRTGTRITLSTGERKSVDYEVDVDIDPPVLQLRRTEHTIGVNTTFVYPSCVKEIFQRDLIYDLKIWAQHGREKPKEFKGLTKDVVDIDVTDWTSGNYCVHAQAFFSKNKKWSNFSEPICTLLHEDNAALEGAQNWGFVAFPFLMLSACAIAFFLWYKKKMKDIKMPPALDFSRFRSTKKWLELSGRELVPECTLTCTEVPLIPGMRRRPSLQMYSTSSPSTHSLSEEDGEDEDEEDDSPIPYTEGLRFQKKERNGQKVAVDEKTPDPSDGSGNSEPNGGCCLPDAMVQGRPLVSTVWMTGVDDTSGSFENRRVSFSENSSVGSSLDFPVTLPVSGTEGQEDENGDIEPDFPTGLQFGGIESHPELTCERLDDTWITLSEIRDNLDSTDLLLQEQITDERSFERSSSSCEGLTLEMPLLKAFCKEDLENDLLAGNRNVAAQVLSSCKCHGYEPKHIPYISRT